MTLPQARPKDEFLQRRLLIPHNPLYSKASYNFCERVNQRHLHFSVKSASSGFYTLHSTNLEMWKRLVIKSGSSVMRSSLSLTLKGLGELPGLCLQTLVVVFHQAVNH